MYLAAIEDADYKEEKIGCEFTSCPIAFAVVRSSDQARSARSANDSLERRLRV
jgi:hypothetical protein